MIILKFCMKGNDINRGVSGSDKTDGTENPIRTKPKKYPTLFGSVQNQTKPI